MDCDDKSMLIGEEEKGLLSANASLKACLLELLGVGELRILHKLLSSTLGFGDDREAGCGTFEAGCLPFDLFLGPGSVEALSKDLEKLAIREVLLELKIFVVEGLRGLDIERGRAGLRKTSSSAALASECFEQYSPWLFTVSTQSLFLHLALLKDSDGGRFIESST